MDCLNICQVWMCRTKGDQAEISFQVIKGWNRTLAGHLKHLLSCAIALLVWHLCWGIFVSSFSIFLPMWLIVRILQRTHNSMIGVRWRNKAFPQVFAVGCECHLLFLSDISPFSVMMLKISGMLYRVLTS